MMSPSVVHLCSLLLFISGAVSASHPRRDATPPVNGHNALLGHGGGGGGPNTFNITDKHYWASKRRTGIHGYVIAGIWLLCGVGFGSYIMIKNSSESYEHIVDHPHSSYIILFSIILFFTILTIVAGSLGVAADQRSMHKSKELIKTILDVGSEAEEIMQRTKNILLTIQTVLNSYNSEAIRVLNVTTHSLRRESVSVKRFIDSSRHSSKEAIVTLYVMNLVVVIANLAFLVAALVSFFFRWPLGLIIVIFCIWILTTLSWIVTGVNFFFQNFAEDTCKALEDFQQSPQNSSLQSVVPCAKSTTSNTLLVQIGYTVHNYMSQINSKLADLTAVISPETQGDSRVWEICNPFAGAPNYTFVPDQCPVSSIPVGNLPNILSRFTCYNSSQNCESEGRFLPEGMYDQCKTYSESLQDLIDIFPDLVSLIQCSQVRRAFSDIVRFQCKPFRKAALQLWSSMLSFSICLVFLTLLWAAKAYQDKGKSFSPCSIVPERV